MTNWKDVYMDKIFCNKCNESQLIIKAGKARRKQRYKCKSCHSYFVAGAARFKNRRRFLRRCAVELYIEGLGIRSISRYLKTSHTNIINWLKVMAKKLKPLLPKAAAHIEIDELYFYLKCKRKKRWLWIAICRETKRILGFAIGGRGKQVIRQLLHSIMPIQCQYYYTDKHGPFMAVIPAAKHQCLPGQTNTIEGINSALLFLASRLKIFNR